MGDVAPQHVGAMAAGRRPLADGAIRVGAADQHILGRGRGDEIEPPAEAGVIEAAQLGVNDFLLKPVSRKALEERLLAVLSRPRQNPQAGQPSGQQQRKLASAMHADTDRAMTTLVLVD